MPVENQGQSVGVGEMMAEDDQDETPELEGSEVAPGIESTPSAPQTPSPAPVVPAPSEQPTGQPASQPAPQQAPPAQTPATQAPAPQAPTAPDVELRRMLEEQSGELAQLRAFKEQHGAAAGQPGAGTSAADAGKSVFIKDDNDLAAFLTQPAKANEILGKLKETAVQDAVTIASMMLTQHIETRLAVREAEKDFLEKNADLKPFRNALGTISAQVKSEHPEWGHADLDKIFEETGKRTRAFLHMQAAGANSPASAPSATPGFAPGTGTHAAPQKLTASQSMLAETFADSD